MRTPEVFSPLYCRRHCPRLLRAATALLLPALLCSLTPVSLLAQLATDRPALALTLEPALPEPAAPTAVIAPPAARLQHEEKVRPAPRRAAGKGARKFAAHPGPVFREADRFRNRGEQRAEDAAGSLRADGRRGECRAGARARRFPSPGENRRRWAAGRVFAGASPLPVARFAPGKSGCALRPAAVFSPAPAGHCRKRGWRAATCRA